MSTIDWDKIDLKDLRISKRKWYRMHILQERQGTERVFMGDDRNGGDWKLRPLREALRVDMEGNPVPLERLRDRIVGKARWTGGEDERVLCKETLDRIDSGELDVHEILAREDRYRKAHCELSALETPGKVYKHEDFKGGCVHPASFIYALRAHLRANPRVHFHGKTLEQQELWLKKALEHSQVLRSVIFGLEEPEADPVTREGHVTPPKKSVLEKVKDALARALL